MDLKPCPFCGGEAAVKSVRQPTNGGKSFMKGWVGCTRCSVYMQWNHDPAGTVRKWNQRIDDPLSKCPSVDKLTSDGVLLLKYCPEAINALAERLASKLDDAFLHGMKGDGHA